MVNDQDRALIVAFVHGELSPIEMQRFSERLKVEADLRQEFEELLAASEKLEDFFAQQAQVDFSAEEVAALLSKARAPAPPRPKRSVFIAGGAVFAASLALVVFTKLIKSPDDLAGEPPTIVSHSPPPSSEAAPQDAALPPLEEPKGPSRAEGKGSGKIAGMQSQEIKAEKNEVALGARAQSRDRLKQTEQTDSFGGSAGVGNAVEDREKEISQAARPLADESIQESEDSLEVSGLDAPATKPAASAAPTAPAKQMGVIASRTKFSTGLNNKKALNQLQRKLDGKPSCTMDTGLASVARVEVSLSLKPNGEVSQIETVPADAQTAQCLKLKLQGQPDGFKSKAGGKITFQLKIF